MEGQSTSTEVLYICKASVYLRLQKMPLSFKLYTSQFVNDSKLIITKDKGKERGGGREGYRRRQNEKEHRLKGLSGKIKSA